MSNYYSEQTYEGKCCVTEQGDLGLGLSPIDEGKTKDEKEKNSKEEIFGITGN